MNKKYFFIGARYYVAKQMLDMGLDIVCFAVPEHSYIIKELERNGISYSVFNNKKELLEIIKNTDFDVLVSNGCPYILPVSELKKENQTFINIHPSLLPDLKGYSPVNGAILFDRPQGATCHIMDDGVDTGPVIARVKVCDEPDMPLDLLYELTFMAEAKAFEEAFKRDFIPEGNIENGNDYIYYSRKEEDQIIRIEDVLADMIKKVKAFQVDSQLARVIRNGHVYKVYDLIPFDTALFDKNELKENHIIAIYKNNIITKKDDQLLLWRLDHVEGLLIGTAFLE